MVISRENLVSRILVAAVLAASLLGFHLPAQEVPADSADRTPWWQDGTGGIVFNYAGTTIDLESYQGGVGLKLQREDIGHRLHADLFFGLDSNTIDMGAGYTRERHLLSGIAQPYVGIAARTRIVRRRTELGTDNWHVDISIPVSFGPVFGVELRPVEFLGIFAEYEIVASINAELSRTSTAGTVESETNFDFFLDAAMGNSGRVGLVVYFPLNFLDDREEDR